MAPYLAIAVVVAICASIGEYLQNQFVLRRGHRQVVPTRRLSRSYFDLLAVAALVSFSALRFQVGTDYPTYYSIYESLDTRDWGLAISDAPQEMGFTLLMLATKSVVESPYAIFWASSLLTVVPAYVNFLRRSACPPLAITLYVLIPYTASFNTVRQSIAISLLFWASAYLGRNKFLFFALAALAATFHTSSVFVAIILLVTLKLTWSFKSVFIISILVVATSLALQAEVAAQWLESVNPRYVGYLDSGETGLGAYLQIAAFLALLVYSTAVGTRRNPLNKNDKRLALLVVVGIIFMVAGTQATIVFRMGGYFSLFLLLLVSNRVGTSNDKLAASGLIGTGAVCYYVARLLNYGEVIPYQTYLLVPS